METQMLREKNQLEMQCAGRVFIQRPFWVCKVRDAETKAAVLQTRLTGVISRSDKPETTKCEGDSMRTTQKCKKFVICWNWVTCQVRQRGEIELIRTELTRYVDEKDSVRWFQSTKQHLESANAVWFEDDDGDMKRSWNRKQSRLLPWTKRFDNWNNRYGCC